MRSALRKEDYNPCFLVMIRCSVIIVTYNSAAAIGDCLEQLASAACEVIVVDNASQDESIATALAAGKQMPLQLIRMTGNIGFAAAVNQGVQAASGEVLLLLNPDAIAEPKAIDTLLECFPSSGAEVVGGALVEEDGEPEKGFVFRRLPTLPALAFEALVINQLWPGNPVNRRYRCLDADYSREQLVEQPAGACLAITRKAWESVGGMDPGFYPVWFEDVDLCARLLRQGATIVHCPQARFRHSGAHSVGQLAFRNKQMFWYRNMVRYAKKHFSSSDVWLLRLAIVVGMGLRSLGCLAGMKPRGLSIGAAIRAYAGVAAWAIGINREPSSATK